MKLIDFMKYQIHFRNKDEKYISDFLVAMKSGLNDTDFVHTLSEEQYQLYLNKGNYDFYYEPLINYKVSNFSFINLNELNVDLFIKLEILIQQHPDEIIATYPGILALLSNTDNPEAFHNIDHALVMPYVDSFFLYLTKLEPHIRQSMEQIKALIQITTLVDKQISIHSISHYINCFLSLEIKDLVK